MPLRFDITKLDDPRRDHNGYLNASAHATRTGVFVYNHPDGSTTRELRHPDEVFKAESIATLKNRPVTDGHPADGKLNSENTRRLSVGSAIDDPKQNDRYIDTNIQITDENVISRVLDSDHPLREMSCGYETEVTRSDGTYQGEPYDHIQTKIKYNHIALVQRGRAGPEVRLQLDSVDAISDGLHYDKDNQNLPPNTDRGHKDMIKIKRDAVIINQYKMDSFEVKIDEGVESGEKAVLIVMDRLDVAHAHIVSLKSAAERMQGNIDALKDQGKTSLADLNERVKERTDAVNAAHYLGLSDYTGMETDELKKAVVSKAYPQVKIDELSKDHIEGRYDTVIEGMKLEGDNLRKTLSLKPTLGDSKSRFPIHGDSLGPREQFLQDTQDMYLSEADRKLQA